MSKPTETTLNPAVEEREAIVSLILRRMDFFERLTGDHNRAIVLEMNNLVHDLRKGLHHA